MKGRSLADPETLKTFRVGYRQRHSEKCSSSIGYRTSETDRNPRFDDPVGTFEDLTDSTLLLKLQTVEFKAVITPDIDPFPTEAVQWTGTFGTTGEGETVSHAYDGAASTSDTDYKTVIAGNKTVNVVVTDKVLGIHSNADPGGSILQPMHAWISLTDFSFTPADLTTYGLWHTSVNPDQNRATHQTLTCMLTSRMTGLLDTGGITFSSPHDICL